MAQIKSGDPHGLFRVFVGMVDTEGYNIGQSSAAPSEGTLLSPYTIKYAQNAEFPLPDRTQINFTGGDVWTGSYLYGITSINAFTLTLSTVEADLIAFTSESSVDQTTNTLQTMFSDNIILPTPGQAWMMTVFRIQSKTAGEIGANKFMSMIFPRVWVSPKGIAGTPNFQAAGTHQYTVMPTIGDRTPFGLLFADTAMNLYEDVAPVYYTITDYPPHLVTFVAQAGATEVVTLPFKPRPYTYTTPDSANQPVQCYVDGEQVDATTINATTGAVTLTNVGGGAFSGGEKIGIFYETNNYVAT